MKKNTVFERTLKDVQSLLARSGFAREKVYPETSLTNDLNLQHHDYYFLKLDLEEMTHRDVDIDEVYECVSIKDLAILILSESSRR